jgi:hypothetical protein
MNVHGYDGNASSNVSAIACVTYYGSQGGLCDSTGYSSGTGDYQITVPHSVVWASGSSYRVDFGFVQVTLPLNTGTQSTLRGLYQAN